MKKLNEFSPERQQFFADSMRSLVEHSMNAGATVGFELVKHFAIINGAGIAGATAYSANNPDGVTSLPWFCLGLVMAIVTMIIVNVNGLRFIRHMAGAQQKILFGDAYIEEFRVPRSVVWTIRLTWVSGGISFVLFLIGVQKMTHVLSFCIG